jgi:hemolysin III
VNSHSNRAQSPEEEIANSIIHGIALLAAIIAIPFLAIPPHRIGMLNVIGTGVFGLTLVMLYLTSMLYHLLPSGCAKRIVLKLDHDAIYLFIAGSYTPFALGVVRGYWGWTLFGLAWSLAFLGALLKAWDRLSHPWLSTGLYLVMGWMVLFAAMPVVDHILRNGFRLLVAGGLAYTLGLVFYMLDSRIRHSHAVWHRFVVAGSGCHFSAILNYAAIGI